MPMCEYPDGCEGEFSSPAGQLETRVATKFCCEMWLCDEDFAFHREDVHEEPFEEPEELVDELTESPLMWALRAANDPSGQGRFLVLPHSEVCMHMKVAGQTMLGKLTPGGMVQLYDSDNREFSLPITKGEAGWE